MILGSTITDQYQQKHVIKSELGKGGQGIVYTTNNPNVAIKLVLTTEGQVYTDENYIQKYKNQLDNLLVLPVSADINLARPICKLDQHAGYVMQQLQGMIPVEDFFTKEPKDIEKIEYPQWLSKVKEKNIKEAYLLLHYAKTGSTKRRFEVLMQCASQLAKLHGQGLVYGDISPENVFFSKNGSFNHVWFIDADNLRFENKRSKKAVYTPGYGAPELVLGQAGASTRTDVYSYAVLAFKLLSLIYPFDGKRLQEGTDDDWADEKSIGEVNISLDDQAKAGLLPFVDDPYDDSNISNAGLPRTLLLTEKLTQLFNHTFNISQTSPWKRPLIYHWPKAMAEAVDISIECPSCSMSYLEKGIIEDHACPYCGKETPSYFLIERNSINQASVQSWRAIRNVESAMSLPFRMFTPFSLENFDEEFIQLEKQGSDWMLSLSGLYSECINIAINRPKEIFSPFSSVVLLTKEELNTGVLLQVSGKSPQQISIMLKDRE